MPFISRFKNNRWLCSLIPYAQLARLQSLTGAWLLVIPCFWGLALAGGTDSLLPQHWVKWVLFGVGGILMRSAGCIWNDIIDRKIDRDVERTADRPLASNKIPVWKAMIFALVLLLLALLTLSYFNTTVITCAILSLPLVVFYPFSKRWLKIPQVVLGLTFSWGSWLGWFSMVADDGFANSLIELAFVGTFLPPLLLYLATFWWIMGYDTIYALQDVQDDRKLPINSSVLWLGKHLRSGLLIFNILCILFFACAALMALAPFSRLILILPFGLHLIFQTMRIKPGNAHMLFKSNVNAGFWACLILILMVAD